jgi:hypothetical protein
LPVLVVEASARSAMIQFSRSSGMNWRASASSRRKL